MTVAACIFIFYLAHKVVENRACVLCKYYIHGVTEAKQKSVILNLKTFK